MNDTRASLSPIVSIVSSSCSCPQPQLIGTRGVVSTSVIFLQLQTPDPDSKSEDQPLLLNYA